MRVEHVFSSRVRAGGRERELAAVQAADLALVLVRAEEGIRSAESVEQLLEHARIDLVVANVDGDRHAHDVLDTPNTGSERGQRLRPSARARARPGGTG